MIFIELFIVFAKIGFTSFGGMSMIPVINQEMLNHQWMSQTDVTNIIAIAEMTPGPLGINCATFAGMQVAGLPGGIIAVLGVLTPAFTTTLLAAIFFEKLKHTNFFNSILYVIRPLCIGLILAVIVSLSLSTYMVSYRPILQNIVIGIIVFLLLYKYKKSVPFVICVAGLLGICVNLIPMAFV